MLGDIGGLYTSLFTLFFLAINSFSRFNANAFAVTHLFLQSSKIYSEEHNTIKPTVKRAFKIIGDENNDCFQKLRLKSLV